jgi:hypothetical protein
MKKVVLILILCACIVSSYETHIRARRKWGTTGEGTATTQGNEHTQPDIGDAKETNIGTERRNVETMRNILRRDVHRTTTGGEVADPQVEQTPTPALMPGPKLVLIEARNE